MRFITDCVGSCLVEYDVRLEVCVYPRESLEDAFFIPPGIGNELFNAFTLMMSLGYPTKMMGARFGQGTRCICDVDDFSYDDFYARYSNFKKENPQDSICNLERYSSPSAAYLTIYRLSHGVYNDQLETYKRILDRYEESCGLKEGAE